MSVVVAGNGTAVRSNGDVTLTFLVNGTKLGQKNSATTPMVYIPVTNPESISKKLQSVKIDFDGGGDSGNEGTVTEFEVYFGNTYICDVTLPDNTTSSYTSSIASKYELPDNPSYGINVALYLNLPNANAYITLYSVDLTFS
jgi:hypothetical protein